MASMTPMTTASASKDSPKIVLHWLEQSRSQRILWLLEELHLPYELKIYHRDAKTMLADPALKKIHPLGKSPVITIIPPGATEPTVIAESAVIVEYLIEHYGKGTTLAPTRWREGMEDKVCGETEGWMRYKYFLHYAEGSLMPLLIVLLIANNIKNGAPFFVRPITNAIAGKITSDYLNPNFESHFGLLEQTLKTASTSTDKPYLCGSHLTGADILLSYPLLAADAKIELLTKEKYPLLKAWIARMREEPGYKVAVEKIVAIEGKYEETP